MEVRVLSWNLFHGRDHPPDPGLHSWRSRLLRVTERGATHAQVNRNLSDQFAEMLANAEWDVALLQECPPRWAERLATACRAEAHLVLTSRNLPRLASLQAAIADFSPDLIASWEGGSNLTLVRSRRVGTIQIAERRELTLTSKPEHRRMAFSRLSAGLCVANLHASTSRVAAEREVVEAARTAVGWSSGAPLVFGGDFNVRPVGSAEMFHGLETEHGLVTPTSPHSIDHLLARGLEPIAPAAAWEDGRREAPDPSAGQGDPRLPIRLSDHAPVEATFGFDQTG